MSDVSLNIEGQKVMVPTCQCKAGWTYNGKCLNQVMKPGGFCSGCKDCLQPKQYPCSCTDNKVVGAGCSHGFLVMNEGAVCEYCDSKHQRKILLVDAPINPMVGVRKSWFDKDAANHVQSQPLWPGNEPPSSDPYINKWKSKLEKKWPPKMDHKKYYEDSMWADLPAYIRKLGFDKRLDLARGCADFYLLERMATSGLGHEFDQPQPDFTVIEMAEARLKGLETMLAKQLSLYLDMVCGGELRYAQPGTVGSPYGTPIEDEVVREYLKRVAGKSRPYAWEKWMRLRRYAPKKTLAQVDTMVEVFEGHWDGSSVGGETWATIARVLQKYLHGKMKPRHFVNMAFSLQHNNALVFDKLWYVSTLNRVLRLQAEEDYDDGILPYASEDVQVLWQHHKKTRIREWERRVDR